MSDTARQLRRLASPHFLHEAVLRLGLLAVERTEREVGLAASLLSALTLEGVLGHRVARLGFWRLLERLDDAALDAPRAPILAAHLMGACMAARVLPFTFIDAVPAGIRDALEEDGAAESALVLCEQLARAAFGSAAAASDAAAAAAASESSVDELKAAVLTIVREYLDSG